MKAGYSWLLLLTGALLLSSPLHATSVETLLMPGKLIAGHAKIETECTKCHVRGSRGDQSALCLDCHKEVREDVQQHRGFHGKSKAVKGQQCKSCHTDHTGRDSDVVGMDKATFDHLVTDFELKGRHKGVQCDRCHQPKPGKPLKFREAPGACIDCHKDDDVHKGKLGTKCADCHSAESWQRDSNFDHSKTKFPLHGAHKKVSCASCHPNERYKGITTLCVDCHKINDVHRGKYGEKCQDCHGEDEWKKIRFDHDRDTKYPLRGRHKDISCGACHGNDIHAKLKSSCIACHKADDYHRGNFGDKCDNCHKEEEWGKAKFDHNKDTSFVLRGKHEKTACVACHHADVHAHLAHDCLSCHRADDVHAGKQGKLCDQCHDPQGWKKNLSFDHDLTAFPLLGMHATASCADCHVNKAYKDAKKDCGECHGKDDVHKGRLGTACAQCHNPNSWKVWRFDHDKQTDFKLEGAHKGLHCYTCHSQAVKGKIDLPKNCSQCHEKDDVHHGNFG